MTKDAVKLFATLLPAAALAIAAVACGSSNAICDADGLRAALAGASAGARVELGECTIHGGNFQAPGGVTVAGKSTSASHLVSTGHEPIFIAAAEGPTATAFSDLSLESSGAAAIIVRGTGSATIERVSVNATLGIGIAAEHLAQLRATDLTLTGPVNMSNVPALPLVITATDSATFGLVLVDVTAAALQRIDISGFARIGAALVDTTATWEDGSSSDNLGVGLAVEGGALNATRVELCRTMQPLSLDLSFGGVFYADPMIETNALHVCDGEGYGLLQVGGSARHVGIEVSGNSNAALWGQEMSSLDVAGSFADNDFAGVVAADVASVNLHDASITRTHESVRLFDTFGTKHVGDGVQLVICQPTMTNTCAAPVPIFSVRDVTLADNDIAGMVIALHGHSTMDAVQLERVDATVTSTTQVAVIAVDGQVAPGWDTGVTRHGTTSLNDAMLANRLDLLGAVAPCDRPRDNGLRLGGVRGATGY